MTKLEQCPIVLVVILHHVIYVVAETDAKKVDSLKVSSILIIIFIFFLAPVFGESSAFGALDPASRKKPAKAPEIKSNGDSAGKGGKSSIPRPQKKESSKKPAAQKHTLDKLIPAVSWPNPYPNQQ